MLKQIAWNTFKNTGNIDTMMELIQVDEVAKNVPKEKLNDNNEKGLNVVKNIESNYIAKENNLFEYFEINEIFIHEKQSYPLFFYNDNLKIAVMPIVLDENSIVDELR